MKLSNWNLVKLLEYGLYVLVFLLPLQTRRMFKLGELNGGYYEYATYSLYAFDVLLLVFLFFCFMAIRF